MNKLIVIEGTDCSGKETQSKLLIEKLAKEGIVCHYFSFPNYDSPTGKIIGGPYLGKAHIGECWFSEGAVSVDPKIASGYYAIDRAYNLPKILELLKTGHVILDRYTYSNMAHQGGKIDNYDERVQMYEWLEKLEFGLYNLPIPDIKLFLSVPIEIIEKLKINREEALDEHEKDSKHLKDAYNAYHEVADKYGFKKIECALDLEMLSRSDISDIIYEFIEEELVLKKVK